MHFKLRLGLTRKARFIAGGHMTDPPAYLTYSSFVTCDSMRLAFLVTALNNLDIMTIDIGNVYLNATTNEKVHTICGPEFGQQHVGKNSIIHKALCGVKSSGAAWHSMFAETLTDLQLNSSLADPVYGKACSKGKWKTVL